MKKNILCLTLICNILILTGCAYSGYKQAGHNGKYYWFNADDDCSQFKYYGNNPDIIHCVDKNGNLNGMVKHPATAEELAQYRYEQQQAQQGLENLNMAIQNFNNNLARTNGQMQQSTYNMQMYNQMQQMNRSLDGINQSLDPYYNFKSRYAY
ncbi:MAG: hypothetical protein SPI03_01775 [Campylobacter sputorum]|uniref:hypothetical protein n=1 Tax=Campylobacter sputorum TaxID=206 RepID=UPI000B76CFFD|nr:hypothetical protein [Campylobacter sputorum]ASM38212.1 hypothetical protein CSPARA_0624 [Campylobacter sputorum bv. paraureolyticus LMG 11764]MDY6120057.1 hypothetical protein [Campylobacter sputorum]